MNALTISVGLLSGAVGLFVYFVFLVTVRDSKERKSRQKQIQSKIDRDNAMRHEVALKLNGLLSNKLEEMPPPSGGMDALLETQKALENVFYEWANENWNLFHLCPDSRISVVGVRNGSFVYELPDCVRRHLKRN